MEIYIEKAKIFLKTNKIEILVFLLFLGVTILALLYSFTLPFTIHGDTYVSLLGNKVATDPTYPDRAFLLNLDFKPYLYTNLLSITTNHFSLYTGKLIIFFFAVFGIGYGAYIGFRMLRFPRSVAILTALVALMPRGEISGGIFAAITPDDVLGSALAIPIMWLVLSWFLQRRFEKKSLWPVMLVSGLSTYMHPVSLIFFNCVLFLTILYWAIIDKNYKKDLKDFFWSIVSFSLGASFLLIKIFTVSRGVSLTKSGFATASAHEYVTALLYRIGFDFFPTSASYIVQFSIINVLFWVAVVYVYYNIRKGKIVKGSLLHFISNFSFFVIIVSVFLSFSLPALQLWLVQKFDFPYILQQTSRFFRYYYLGIFLLWGVAVTVFLEQYKEKRKILFTILLILGIVSSTFFFEVFQFSVGYYGYQREYIPAFLQKAKDVYSDGTKVYPALCDQITQSGITRNDLILYDDFTLRYWCESRLYTTFEEGTIYLLSGKNQLVWWYKTYLEQEHALHFGDVAELTAFAKKVGARYAFLNIDSPIISTLEKKGEVVSKGSRFDIIRFKQ